MKTRGLDASKFACQLSGSIGPPSGENEKIAKVLEDIADGYDTRNHQHDQYRVKEYKKLSAMVAKFPTPLRRAKDLLSTVGKISEKMLKRVDEIIESGNREGFLRHPSWIRSTVPARGPSRSSRMSTASGHTRRRN